MPMNMDPQRMAMLAARMRGMAPQAAPQRPMPAPPGRANAMPVMGPPRPMAKGGQAKAYAKGGSIDGCAQRGKTKGRVV